jgi:hypothetical protein
VETLQLFIYSLKNKSERILCRGLTTGLQVFGAYGRSFALRAVWSVVRKNAHDLVYACDLRRWLLYILRDGTVLA